MHLHKQSNYERLTAIQYVIMMYIQPCINVQINVVQQKGQQKQIYLLNIISMILNVLNVEEKRNGGKNMIKKEKIMITIALVASCITATPVAAKNVENNTYQICRNDIFIDWYQLNCKKIISEIKDDGCYIAVNLGDWLKEQDIYDISVTEDNESEGYKEMYYERNPEKEEKDEFYDTDDTAYIPFERLVYEGDVISYTDSSIETVTDVKENGDFYTKITSMPKLPLKDMD